MHYIMFRGVIQGGGGIMSLSQILAMTGEAWAIMDPIDGICDIIC